MPNTREITENGRYNVRLDSDIQVNVPTKDEDIRTLREQIASTRLRSSPIFVSDGQVEVKSPDPLGWNVLNIDPDMMAADMVVVDGKVQVNGDYYQVSGLSESQEREMIVAQSSPLVVNNIPVFATKNKRVKWEWSNGNVWVSKHEETWTVEGKIGDTIRLLWDRDFHNYAPYLELYVDEELLVRDQYEPHKYHNEGVVDYTMQTPTVVIKAVYGHGGQTATVYTDNISLSIIHMSDTHNVEYYPLLSPNEGQGLRYGFEPINTFGPYRWNSGSKESWSYEINPREYSWDILYRKELGDYFSDEIRQNTTFIQDGFNIPLYDIVRGEEHYNGYIKAEPNQNFYDGQFEIVLNNHNQPDCKYILRWGGNEHWTDSTGRERRYYFVADEYIDGGRANQRAWESDESGKAFVLSINLRIGKLTVTFYYDGTSRGIVGFSVHFDFDLHTNIGYGWDPAVVTIHPFDVSQYFNQDAIQNACVFIFNEDNIKTI